MCRARLHSCSPTPPATKMAVSSLSTVVQSAPMQLTAKSSSPRGLGNESQQTVGQAQGTNGLTVCQNDAGAVAQLELNPRGRGSKEPASVRSSVAGNQHECPVCGKVLRNARCLRSHLKTHSGEKPYSCNECDSQFTAKCHMVIHARIHSGERPYTCDVCKKEFMQSPHLKSHMITHSKDKKFQCTTCPKTFKFKNSLKIHLREHSNVGNFVCETCEKCYPTKKRLMSHVRVHSSEKPFQCDVCGKKFKDASYITKHKLKFCKNEGYKKRWKLYKKTMNEAKSLTLASKDVPKTHIGKISTGLTARDSSATLTPERPRDTSIAEVCSSTRSINQSGAAPAEEQPKERRSRGRPAGSRNRKSRRKKVVKIVVTNDASDNEFEELLNSHRENHVSSRQKLSRSTSIELSNSGGVPEDKDDISFSCFEGLADKESVSTSSEVTGSDELLQPQYSVSVLNEDHLPQEGASSKPEIEADESVNRNEKQQVIDSSDECVFRRKQLRDREWYEQQPIESNILVQKQQQPQQPLQQQQQQLPHHLNHTHVHDQHQHPLQQQIQQQQQRHVHFCTDSQQHKQVTHNVDLTNQFQQAPMSGKVIPQEQQHQQRHQECPRDDEGAASNYSLERGCDTLPQLLPSLPETLYQENSSSTLGQHQYSTSYHVPQTHHLDTHALYSYSDNIKDLFMSMLPGNYDHSLMVDGQDNAQNLTLSHDISVHGNLENMPQNLSTIPQNLTNLSNSLPSLSDNLSGPAHSMSMTQNFMTLPQNLVAGGGGSLSPLPLLTSHSQNQAPMPQNLSSIQQNPPFSHNIASDNHSSVGQDMSRLAHINSHLPGNAINFATQNHSHLSNSLSNGMLQNLALPQNLSSSADTLPSMPQNLSIMTGNLTPMSANPILSQNSLPQNLTSQTVCSMPKNLTTFSHSVYNTNHHSTPQNLSCHANFSTGGHDMMPPVQDLSLPQNLSSSHLTDAHLAEEIIQPQNLSQSNMTQPENLSVPQNLTSNQGSQRRNACINQPQNLSLTNNGLAPQPMTNKDLSTPQNLTCTTLQMPQNLSFHHSQNETHGLSNIQLNSNRNLNTNISRNSGNFSMRSQNMSFNSNNMHMPLILAQPNMTYPENLSHHNFHGNQSMSIDDPFSHSLTSPDNFTLPSNVGNVQKFTGPENLSNPKMHSQTIQDLSCHSKMTTPHQDNVPENLSLASCLDSQPQNLSRALQPQNLSHESKTNSTYPNDSLNSQSFAMQQPQNLTLSHNWM